MKEEERKGRLMFWTWIWLCLDSEKMKYSASCEGELEWVQLGVCCVDQQLSKPPRLTKCSNMGNITFMATLEVKSPAFDS